MLWLQRIIPVPGYGRTSPQVFVLQAVYGGSASLYVLLAIHLLTVHFTLLLLYTRTRTAACVVMCLRFCNAQLV